MTLSRLLRRSGVAVLNYCDQIGWTPDTIILVGMGVEHAETFVFREAWPETNQVGIEPCPDIPLDNFDGELHRCAISDYVGYGSLSWRTRHRDGASLCPIPDAKNKSDVPVTTLDELYQVHQWQGEKLLWLDCEGNELRALSCAENLLDSVHVVNVELTTWREKRCQVPDEWADPRAVHAFLNGEGFIRVANHTIRDAIGQVDAIYARRSLLDKHNAWGLVQCPCQMKCDECE